MNQSNGISLQHPLDKLKDLSNKQKLDIDSIAFAEYLDQIDEIKSQRDRFILPLKKNVPNFQGSKEEGEQPALYFCGQSLGLCPKIAYENVAKVLDNWSKLSVFTHTEGYLPAAYCDLPPKEKMASLVGAEPNEVAIMNGLTVNLHILLTTFYRPTADRYKIIIEEHAFPSDMYAVTSQVELHNLDPSKCLIKIRPRKGEHLLNESDIEQLIDEHASTTSVILLPGLQYYTGQWIDVPRLTSYAQSKGILVGVDLAHSVGNIAVQLNKWNVDFACWCTYKYLCSGPGGIAGIYVNKRHTDKALSSLNESKNGNAQPIKNIPALKGWWGNKLETKFNMGPEFDAMNGADMFKLSNPPPLLSATLMASLEIYNDATLEKIIAKQRLITGYFEYLLKKNFDTNRKAKQSVQIITPSDVNRRGAQLSLMFSLPLDDVQKEMEKRGIICDIRMPNVMRATPVPLYTRYVDVFLFIENLRNIFDCKQSKVN